MGFSVRLLRFTSFYPPYVQTRDQLQNLWGLSVTSSRKGLVTSSTSQGHCGAHMQACETQNVRLAT